MSHLTESSVHQVYEWYMDIERRLGEVVRVLPFVETAQMKDERSPRLASILLEVASLVDTLLKDQLPDSFMREEGRPIRKKNANINDYRVKLEPVLKLSRSQSLLLLGLPSLLSPFAPWADSEDYKMPWWRAYNRLKHDRLSGSGGVTLADCLQAACALNQVMMNVPIIRSFVFRFGWAQLAGHNPQMAIKVLGKSADQGYVAYTDFFATFLCPVTYRSVDDIRPIDFRNSERLQFHLGRLLNASEI
jgi:hypothetical protein